MTKAGPKEQYPSLETQIKCLDPPNKFKKTILVNPLSTMDL